MTIYTLSRDDLYDYLRCPKIVAIKAYQALKKEPTWRAVPERSPRQPRSLEPTMTGRVGEAVTQLGLPGLPEAPSMEQTAKRIREVNLNEHLNQIVLEALKGLEKIQRKLVQEYGEVKIIGKGEGRHPDLASTVQPDSIAYVAKSKHPIMAETKNSVKPEPADEFQARFYNGIAERHGVYLLEHRFEHGNTAISPKLVQSRAETLLIYPRQAYYKVVRDSFVPDQRMIEEVWKAKELGFKGQMPETDCGNDCAHWKLGVDLPESDIEPLPPLPLIFSQGLLEGDYNLDIGYQVAYLWEKLLPKELIHALLMGRLDGGAVSSANQWKESLVKAGLDREAVDISLDLQKWQRFHNSKPSVETLLKSMMSELEPWEKILKKRLAPPLVLEKATSIYSLPTTSASFVKDAWNRWQ